MDDIPSKDYICFINETSENLPTERTTLGEESFRDMILSWGMIDEMSGTSMPLVIMEKKRETPLLDHSWSKILPRHAPDIDLHNNPFKESIKSPAFLLGKLRLREFKKLVQSHRAR